MDTTHQVKSFNDAVLVSLMCLLCKRKIQVLLAVIKVSAKGMCVLSKMLTNSLIFKKARGLFEQQNPTAFKAPF